MDKTWDAIFRDTTQFWVQFVLVPVIVIIGIFGNSLTIYVLTSNQMRLSSKVYLTAITISDFLFLIFSFSMTWKHYEYMQSVHLYWAYLPLGLWITDASSSASVWLTVAFTIERYVAICHPKFAKRNLPQTEHRAAIIVIIVFLTCFLLTASTLFEWQVSSSDCLKGVGANLTVYNLENTNFGKNAWYRLIYRWFSTILFVILPLLILTIGNIFLINAVRSSHKIRQELVSCYVHRHQAQKMLNQDRATIKLVIIVFIYFVCQLPTAAILIYTSIYTPLKDSVEENVLLGLGNLFNLLVAINAECNFILYAAVSEKYKRSFIRLFCLHSVFKRWYDKKHRSRGVFVIPNAFSRRGKSLKTNDATELVPENEDKKGIKSSGKAAQRKCLAIMRMCTTCEFIRQGSVTTSLEESGVPNSK